MLTIWLRSVALLHTVAPAPPSPAASDARAVMVTHMRCVAHATMRSN